MATSARSVLSRLKSYSSPELDTTYDMHGIHPYPAKFIPQIPADVIRSHTNERHLVFDPFCGSGTTLAEAQRLGRRSIGVDSNPIAVLVSRAKTAPQSEEGIKQLEGLGRWARAHAQAGVLPSCPRPQVPRLEHWFQERVIDELAYLRKQIAAIEDGAARSLAECIFSAIIVGVSNQESETRYVAKQKRVPGGDVFRRFAQRLTKILPLVPTRDRSRSGILTPAVYCADIRSVGQRTIPDDTADLVVTSPPYANSFDYYLYHKWRMAWLGYDVRQAQEQEIGSRHEHSSKKAPIGAFETKMLAAMKNISRVLKPSKLAYFLIGDSIIAGEFFDSETILRRLAQESNLRFIESIAYPLQGISRSFREKAGADRKHDRAKFEKQQRVVVFEAIRPKSIPPVGRKYAAHKISHREVMLSGVMAGGQRIAIQSSDRARHVHSLARYPSKFIPALPAWAIETFCPPNGVVLDPFSGSGTTSVEALVSNRPAIAADVSPFSCLVTRAKTTIASEKEIRREGAKLHRVIGQKNLLPRKSRLEFDLDTFWFEAAHLTEFAKLRHFIELEIAPKLRDFFLASLAATIRPFSYQDEAQIKVKRDPKKLLTGTPDPSSILAKRLDKDIERLIEFNSMLRGAPRCDVHLLSADKVGDIAQDIDLVVTSPPYINAMNYPMTHRYENVLLGLIRHEDNRIHERQYFGTERVSAVEYSHLNLLPSEWSAAKVLNRSLERIYALEAKRSFIAYKYFLGMRAAIAGIGAVIKNGGHLVVVVGRNRIRGVPIDTFAAIASFARDQGLCEVTQFEYQIYKNSLKLTRHGTADVIDYDGVAVFRKMQ